MTQIERLCRLIRSTIPENCEVCQFKNKQCEIYCYREDLFEIHDIACEILEGTRYENTDSKG
jgi:hypothetical protein